MGRSETDGVKFSWRPEVSGRDGASPSGLEEVVGVLKA